MVSATRVPPRHKKKASRRASIGSDRRGPVKARFQPRKVFTPRPQLLTSPRASKANEHLGVYCIAKGGPSMKSSLKLIAAVVAFFTLASAQTATGVLQGRVVDATGAVV